MARIMEPCSRTRATGQPGRRAWQKFRRSARVGFSGRRKTLFQRCYAAYRNAQICVTVPRAPETTRILTSAPTALSVPTTPTPVFISFHTSRSRQAAWLAAARHVTTAPPQQQTFLSKEDTRHDDDSSCFCKYSGYAYEPLLGYRVCWEIPRCILLRQLESLSTGICSAFTVCSAARLDCDRALLVSILVRTECRKSGAL